MTGKLIPSLPGEPQLALAGLDHSPAGGQAGQEAGGGGLEVGGVPARPGDEHRALQAGDDHPRGVALNRARLPEPKEAVIGRFRRELERRGIATGGWWQGQLDLCLIGIMATFGWEKALGDAGELSWWEAQVAGAAARQGILPPAPAG